MAYDVLYIDHGNLESNKNFEQLKSKVPYAVKQVEQVKTDPYWTVSSFADTSNFNFGWQPHVYEKNFKHCGKNQYGLADNGIVLQQKQNADLHINDYLKIQT